MLRNRTIQTELRCPVLLELCPPPLPFQVLRITPEALLQAEEGSTLGQAIRQDIPEADTYDTTKTKQTHKPHN